MCKQSGGTRNYANTPTYDKRKGEYGVLMSSGDYVKGHLYRSGGFYVIHKHHDKIVRKNNDYSDIAAQKLAKKGYKVYLDDERSFMQGDAKYDGHVYKVRVDFKTIKEAGTSTMKKQIEKASKQGAEVVVFYQRSKSITKEYVLSQLELFRTKSPKLAREKIKEVYVVGLSGGVHRHKI